MNTSYPKPDVEKVRKPQWTVENTRKTQSVVDELIVARDAIRVLISGHTFGEFGAGRDSGVSGSIDRAIKRFKVLDPGVK